MGNNKICNCKLLLWEVGHVINLTTIFIKLTREASQGMQKLLLSLCKGHLIAGGSIIMLIKRFLIIIILTINIIKERCNINRQTCTLRFIDEAVIGSYYFMNLQEQYSYCDLLCQAHLWIQFFKCLCKYQILNLCKHRCRIWAHTEKLILQIFPWFKFKRVGVERGSLFDESEFTCIFNGTPPLAWHNCGC